MTPRPRRVLLVETTLDRTVGGSHQCLYDLVARLDRKAWEPRVLFYQDNLFVERFEALGVPTTVWEAERAAEVSGTFRRASSKRFTMRARLPGNVLRRLRYLRRERIDFVHINNSPLGNFEDWLPAARLAGVPITTHQRGIYVAPEGALARWLARRFDAVVAISRCVAQGLESGGIPASSIRTIHDGVDLGRWLPRPPEESRRLRAEAKVPDDAMLVVLVGLLRSWKGQRVALEALAALAPEVRQRVRLWIIGEAPNNEQQYAHDLQQFVRERALDGIVSFLGYRSDIPQRMGAADVVLHASTLPEPFGLVVVEGMALGKAVVASRLGGPAEIIGPGDGLLFDPANPRELTQHLTELAGSPERRRELGVRARERARAFDAQRTAAAVTAVWREILDRS
jgi:glycosyltransferase involved in cell wall biosynthesis